ncbi:MAG: uracil phosphoribosyltransferase, partial [Anaerolineales bacterium]|nr:uracil phosphoribosyltransferase [Anaerolineales bacterium]
MIYESKHPLVKHKLTLLRDVRTKPKKFRELIQEVAMLLCYEATADLQVTDRAVETPMGLAQGHELLDKIGLIPILRAGLGMVQGIWQMMPGAEVWH